MPRKSATSAEVRRQLDRIRALRGDAQRLRELALEVLPGEGNPELLAAALRALGPNVRIEDHGLLRELYDDLDRDGKRRDPGGLVRIEVMNVLWHLRNAGDRELALNAAATFEGTLQGNGAMIRAAGLALLGVLDPPAASLRAAEMLGSADADRMNGEPAVTAARLLAANGESAALALYAHANWRSGPAEVVAECLRGLSPVPPSQLGELPGHLARSQDDVLLLGLCDYVIGHGGTDGTSEIAARVFRSSGHDEVYGYLAAAVVASRDDGLMAAFLDSLKLETEPLKRNIAAGALELAAPSPAVDEARAALAKAREGRRT